MRGVRARLTATLVALVALTAIVLGVGSYLFVDGRIHEQALDEARRQAIFDLSVLAPSRWEPPMTEAKLREFTQAFIVRGVDVVVATEPPFYAPADLITLDPPSAAFRSLVEQGQIAYEWSRTATRPVLVIGGLMPPSGPALYFVHDASAIGRTLDLLRLTFVAGALLLIALALLAARIVARGVLAPVEAAADAAGRIEEGDLSARVPETSRDEFGVWARRFNAMAETLEHNITRLREAEAQNRRFVADVAHELRTPLAALVAEASILRDHLDALPAESRRAGELLVSDVGRLRALVDDLMEISRFDAGAEETATEPIDLVALVRTVVARRHPGATLHLPDAPVVVDTDARRLERIIDNVLDNALEHAPGAPVDVTVRADAVAATIVVDDAGPGVDPERIGRIFERFYKADPSRHGGSSGLGLAIAAEHAALVGGELRAANRAAGGLTIELRLPVTRS
jgi:two-component system sensor histidine kinase MtrB